MTERKYGYSSDEVAQAAKRIAAAGRSLHHAAQRVAVSLDTFAISVKENIKELQLPKSLELLNNTQTNSDTE